MRRFTVQDDGFEKMKVVWTDLQDGIFPHLKRFEGMKLEITK